MRTNTIGKGLQQRLGMATNWQILRVIHRLKHKRESVQYTGETIKCRARQYTSGENLRNITRNPELNTEPSVFTAIYSIWQ